jgi:hypothetical protein
MVATDGFLIEMIRRPRPDLASKTLLEAKATGEEG